MVMPKEVKLVEVGPRDGLQNEPVFVPTELKIALINKLSQTGLKYIEASSFVAPNKIPQLADGEQVFSDITRKPDIHYSALVPNNKGLERALSANVKSIAVFGSASESFSQKNINCSISESIERFTQVIAQAKKHGLFVRAYISCVLGCPYEGDVDISIVSDIAASMIKLGADEISLGDTIGIGTPNKAAALIKAVSSNVPLDKIAMHFHDTYGQAIANIYASLEQGVHIFDTSIAGLGGCPYANGATGNVATEDVLYLLNGLGINTGVDLIKCAHAGKYICQQINRKNQSKVANAIL